MGWLVGVVLLHITLRCCAFLFPVTKCCGSGVQELAAQCLVHDELDTTMANIGGLDDIKDAIVSTAEHFATHSCASLGVSRVGALSEVTSTLPKVLVLFHKQPCLRCLTQLACSQCSLASNLGRV